MTKRLPDRPARRFAVATCVMALAAFGFAACGSSDEDQVRDAVNEFRDAAKEKDSEAICDQFTQEALERLTSQQGDAAKKACNDNIKQNADALAKEAEKGFEIKEVKVDGDKATVKTETEGEGESTAEFVKEDDEWKLSDPGS